MAASARTALLRSYQPRDLCQHDVNGDDDDDDDDDIGDENDDGEDYPTKADHLLLDRGCWLPPSVFQWERPDFWQMSSHFSEN